MIIKIASDTPVELRGITGTEGRGFAISGLQNRYQVIVRNNGKVAVFNPQRTLPCYAILSTCTAPYFAFVAMTKHQFSIDQNNVIARSASPDYNAPTVLPT